MTTFSITPYKANAIIHPDKAHMVDTPSSSFTAVNGRDSSASAATISGDAVDSRSTSSDRPAPFPAPGATSPPRRRSFATQHDEWAPNGVNGDSARTAASTTHATPQQSASVEGSSREGSHKRKRSESVERQNSSSRSYQSHGIPRSPPKTMAHRNSNGPEDARPTSSGGDHSRRGSYTSAPHNSGPRHDDGREHDRHTAPYYGQNPRPSDLSQPHDDVTHTEHRLAEALRRESVNMDHMERRSETRTAASNDDDDDDHDDHHHSRGQSRATEPGGPENTPTSGVQLDHRRRKRVFSNRTKTGCLTCRRRKKKCDELKPECNNCIRGGFVCEGYSNRVEWSKSSRDKVPVPLQAKDGEGQSTPTHAGPQASMSGGTAQASMGHTNLGREQSPAYRPAHPPHSGASGALARPILLDEDRDQRRSGPASPKSRAHSDARSMEWNKPSWPTSSHPPYLNEHLPKSDFQRVPPIRDLPRAVDGSETTTTTTTTTTPQSAISHRSLLNSQSSHSTAPTSGPSTPQLAQAQAQLALQHHNSMRGHQPNRSEKEKMLAGELYFPNAPELVYERDRCKAAIWRFNNSMNPTLGISREERLRLFRDVVQPREPPASSTSGGGSGSATPQSPMGRVGENVIVEAPFICDYGYNITIARDVLIDSNCTIKDTCSVNIGPRTVIGPNVKLLTATMPIDPRRRKGSQGPSLGRAIIVEEDCWIGAGAIILPGLSIGKSSTVGAGSVVTRDVPPFTVVAGNPARVHRGIYPNEAAS